MNESVREVKQIDGVDLGPTNIRWLVAGVHASVWWVHGHVCYYAAFAQSQDGRSEKWIVKFGALFR